MNNYFRRLGLGALLLLALFSQPSVLAQYDPGSRDPEEGSDSASERKAASKLKAAIGQKAPDFSFSASDGKTYRVSDFAGRWLLLQIGGSWCPSSETTAQYFSFIRKDLEGKPFEFVEIYEDLSLADAVFNSLTDFHGIRAFAGLDGAPEFYRIGSIPVWYLIDPKGVIRLDGQYEEPQALRDDILGVLKQDPRFSGISPTISEEDQRYLAPVSLNQERKWKEAAVAWDEVLKDNPANPFAVAKHARCIAWAQGYMNACKDLDEKLKVFPQGVPDILKFFQATYQLKGNGKAAEGAKTLASLQGAHPDSKYLSSALLTLTKTPDELSNQEFQDLGIASRFYGEFGIPYFYGYALERHGKVEESAVSLSGGKKSSGRDAYPLAGLLHRMGLDDQAKAMLFGQNPPTPENANKAMAWELAMSAALLEDWDQSAAYAQRYEQHQPKRGEGPLYQMLAAIRQSKPDKAKELRSRLEQILTENYKSAPLIQGDGPPRDQLMSMGDENARMVTALSAYLFAQMDGQSAKAANIRRNALNSWQTSSFNYALIYAITTPPGEETFKAKARIAEKIQQRKGVKETLDAVDAKLLGGLGVSTNNPAEADKIGSYFLAKLSPVYEGLRTNEFFPQMKNYRKEVEASFALAAGLKQLAQLPDYCSSNNISMDDLTAFLNGSVINDLAYADTPVSEEARRQYIAIAESSATNGITAFYSGPYKNWESLSAFVNKRKAYAEEMQRKRSAPATPAPTPAPYSSPSPQPSASPLPTVSPQPTETPAG